MPTPDGPESTKTSPLTVPGTLYDSPALFDSLALAAVADELRDRLGARVQRVVQVDRLSVGLELYARGERRWLYATADPERSGLWLVDEPLGQAPGLTSPLLLLLRYRRSPHGGAAAGPAAAMAD